MRSKASRHSENRAVRVYRVPDSRAPHVEQFVHYQFKTEGNSLTVSVSNNSVQAGSDAAIRHPFPVPPQRL